jgi:DNA repair exonuclease SbcCD ATPase subunit
MAYQPHLFPQEQCKHLEATLAKVRSQKTKIEEELEKVKEELEDQVNDLESEKEDLESEKSELESTINYLTEDIDDLKKVVTAYEEGEKTLYHQLANLQRKVEVQIAEIEGLKHVVEYLAPPVKCPYCNESLPCGREH